jgi:Uma2 family endonuclease
MAVQLVRRSFTVEDYHRMAQAGILREDDRVELLDGEIVTMAPIGSRHQACVDRLTDLLSPQVARRAILRVEGPICLGEHSEPQPDVALLRPRADFYAQGHPRSQDVLLIIEATETSATYDGETKVPLYAGAGIPDVWLIDPSEERIELCRQPSPQGYQQVQRLRRGDYLAPAVLPDVVLAVEAVLG